MYSHKPSNSGAAFTHLPDLISWKNSLESELNAILLWWMENMMDPQGGFYGRMDGEGKLYPDADRGMVYLCRILWTFSSAARITGSQSYRRAADHAYEYLMAYGWDKRDGGVYWSINTAGQPVDTKKQIYGQAFALYAFSEYYRLTGKQPGLDRAMELFDLMERFSRDHKRGGYFEAFTHSWEPIQDLRLSEKDANEAKTMNTHLHVMEGYTTLYLVEKDPRVANALGHLIDTHLQKFIREDNGHLNLFFDENWNPKSDIISYGHDIEAVWLLVEAAEALGDAQRLAKVKERVQLTARAVLQKGLDPLGGLYYEQHGAAGALDAEKHWWPQAEAMVGFYEAYALSGEDVFKDASSQMWAFIQEKIIDDEKGEWLWSVFADGTPNRTKDKAGPWKGPYHNARACLEMIQRLEKALEG